jgi:antitoxin component of RelBE/YafQ-DinJ toxin-antitoxin module
MIKKSITIRVNAETKEHIQKLAKAAGLNVSAFICRLVDGAERESRVPRVTLYDKDMDIFDKIIEAIKLEGVRHAEDRLEVQPKALRTGEEVVFYTPEAWFVSFSKLSTLLGVPESTIERTINLSEKREFMLLNPRKPDKATKPLLDTFLKTLNIYSMGGAADLDEALRKLFKTEIHDGVVLVRRIDPMALTKFCKENKGKKVVYLLNITG